MLEHVMGSVNEAVRLACLAIAPGVQVVRGHPRPPATFPAECWRLYWLSIGEDANRGNQVNGLLQVDVFVPGGQLSKAAQRASDLGKALGFTLNAGGGRLAVYQDGDVTKPIGEVTLAPLPGEGWVNVEDDDPDIIHFARTIRITATPLL